jgi:hypothetical protein
LATKWIGTAVGVGAANLRGKRISVGKAEHIAVAQRGEGAARLDPR